MCPEAAARIASPAATSTPPAAIHAQAGCASHRYAMAKTKPKGTRARVAIRDQLGTAASQKMPRSANHFLGADLQQSRVGFAVVRKGRLAFRMAESNRAGAKWAGADRIGRAK